MVSARQKAINLFARSIQKPALALVRPPLVARFFFDLNARLFFRTPRRLRQRREVLEAGGQRVPAAWLDLGGPNGRGVIFYVHGGAFMLGSLRGYRHLVARLADAAGMAACFVEYRLAPEHPYPAAPDDVLCAYRALLGSGIAARRIAVVGDSAGGCLALSLLHRIGAEALPMPGAVVAMSPIVDFTEGSPSLKENEARDILIPLRWARRGLAYYLQDADPRDPVVSPVFGRYDGAPPVLLQVSESEVLRDDSRRMAEVLRSQGVTVRLDEWQDVPHVWQINAGRSPEADKGVTDIADFLMETLGD